MLFGGSTDCFHLIFSRSYFYFFSSKLARNASISALSELLLDTDNADSPAGGLPVITVEGCDGVLIFKKLSSSAAKSELEATYKKI